MPILKRVFSRRTLIYLSGGTAVATAGGYWFLNSGPAYPLSTLETRRPPAPWTPPSRKQMLDAIRNGDRLDMLIVGGGATGAGVAVDAATRGLRVALVERDDFSSGTSSKSTKLVHGGVRYLQKAVMELDYEQYKLVREALHERKIFLQTAPYLSAMLPIMLPVYKYWQIPYYWSGCKMYDILAGKENMESSYLMSKGKALEAFPMLKSDGLVGALVYYDGQHNDARMNIALVMTAVKHGAMAANYCEVTKLHKDSAGKLVGARLKDNLSGTQWDVHAKTIVNATGPFSDELLTLDDPSHKPIVQPSSGIHITLPNYYSPRKMGLLDPSTSDGRVIFFLPWQGNTIAGTTDSPAPVSRDPKANEEEIRWVLEEVRKYLTEDIKVRRGDVLSAWNGLRPLVRNPNAASTEGLVRSHMIYVSPSGLLTIAGGKWTTYRRMAEETVDEAVKLFNLPAKSGCVTEKVRLVGSDGWNRNMFIGLIQRYGLETDVAKQLSNNYGDRAWTVCELAPPTGKVWPLHGIRLDSQYPYIDAEVRYAVRHEYAQHVTDVLARRTRLSFLSVQASLRSLPLVVDIMGEELNWSRSRKWKEIQDAVGFLESSMGLTKGTVIALPEPPPRGVVEHIQSFLWKTLSGKLPWSAVPPRVVPPQYSRARFEPGEVDIIRSVFDRRAKVQQADSEKKVGASEILDMLKEVSVPGYADVSKKTLDYVLAEGGYKRKTELGLHEFLEICGNLKEVSFTPSPSMEKRGTIPVEKSGGGV